MCGDGNDRNAGDGGTWYDLVDPSTDRIVGQVTRAGDVRSADPEVERRVRTAYSRSLIARDEELMEELGVCFAGIESIEPGTATHADLVFRHLGVLTGLIPAESGNDSGRAS